MTVKKTLKCGHTHTHPYIYLYDIQEHKATVPTLPKRSISSFVAVVFYSMDKILNERYLVCDAGHFLCNSQKTFSVVLPTADLPVSVLTAGHCSNRSLWKQNKGTLGDFVYPGKPTFLLPKASHTLFCALYREPINIAC